MFSCLLGIALIQQQPVEPIRLTQVTNAYPYWHPSGEKIVYQSNAGGNYDLYTLDRIGEGVRRIVESKGNDITPVYSHDGKKIVFVSDRDGHREVYVCKEDGTDQQNITKNPAMDLHPVWSKDDKRIMFSSNRGNSNPDNYDIYVMDADGGHLKQITKGPEIDTYASWSPDGSKMVTRRVIDGANNEVFVMDVDGSNPKNLSNSASTYDGWPMWSPDGNKIVFASGPGGASPTHLMLMNADGSDKRKITFPPSGTTFIYDTQPCFSADGKYIVFTRYRNFSQRESSDIVVIPVPG
jgi:TolB protein